MGKYLTNSTIVATITLLGITGCSNNQNELIISESNKKVLELQQKIEAQKTQISQLEEDKTDALNSVDVMNVKNNELRDENAILNALVPPNAKPGECYAKVLVPAQYETKEIQKVLQEARENITISPATYKLVEQKVTIREASSRLVSVPATYKTITQKILVKPESVELVVVPATYKTVMQEVLDTPESSKIVTIPGEYKTIEEKIMVEPEKTELVTVPATYKEVSEKVLVKEAYTVWKQGRGEIEKVDNSTGNILCLVEVPATYETLKSKVIDTPAHTKSVVTPAVYKTVEKRVLIVKPSTKEIKIPATYKSIETQVVDTPATTKEVKIPAEYKLVQTQVVDTPATTKEVKIPAICKLVKKRELVTPAIETKTNIPAIYANVPTKVKTADSYLKWQSILCETNTTPEVISNLQRKLQNKNYNITNITGIYDDKTKAAVREYQKANGLNEGALTLKTLKTLGL